MMFDLCGFAEVRELSECETAKKGGAVCGDLGWVTLEDCYSAAAHTF